MKVELGLEAFADASAGLSKFVRASLAGTAFARAQAGIQLQLPLNLFSEFGLAARAEAIAEAAAGVRADFGLSIGDFVLLAQRDPASVGLPMEMLLLFLEEVSIGGEFEVNVSASAKAHASLTITGRVIEKQGNKAGFFYTIDAGVGLAAGVGMGFGVGAEFKDFRRFFGRATDRAVDAVVLEIASRVGTSNRNVVAIAEAFAPVAKIALRTAYDVGQKISENNPVASTQNMSTLCNEVVKTVLEECQRFLLNGMLQGAVDGLHSVLRQKAAALGDAAWQAALSQRSALASRLLAMPDDPFQPTEGNIDYWHALVSSAGDLLDKVYGSNADPAAMEGLCILYATSELLIEAVRSKVNKASAYAMAVGSGTVNADTRPFQGALSPQPIPSVKLAINAALGAAGNANLAYADLLRFLVRDTVVSRLLGAAPGVAEFMRMFSAPFGKTEKELVQIFLQNAASFMPAPGGGGKMDPRATLRAIVNALDTFIAERFRAQAMPVILQSVPSGIARTYIEEVLLEAVLYVKDVGLQSILNWDKKSFDNDDFTEALAGVMLLLTGRTVVLVGDTFITATQERFAEVCAEIAGKIRNGDQAIAPFGLSADPDLVRIVADSVDIAGEVLGTLPAETRTRVRHLLYQVLEPIPPGREHDFLEDLADQLFIPNGDDLRELTDELASIAKRRFGDFVQKFALAIGNYVLEQLEELLLDLVDLVIHWERRLADALDRVVALLRNLESELARLDSQLIDLLESADSALRDFLGSLSGPSLKSGLRNALGDLVFDKALGPLADNDIYKSLPRDLRRFVRSTLRSAIRGVVDGPLVAPVTEAIGAISGALDDLLIDCRELDPDENLAEQVLRLVQDKIEDSVRDHFGSTKPHIDISFDVPYRDLFGNPHTLHFSLGRVSVDLGPLLDAVHDAIDRLDVYHGALDDACVKLASALAKELEVGAAALRRDDARKGQSRLAKIAAEHDHSPREIAILDPTDLSHHESKVAVRIHLGGVPASFLGFDEDEQQRVFVFVNGEERSLRPMVVDANGRSELPARATAIRQSGPASAAPTLTTRLRRDVKGRGIIDYGLANVMPGRGNPASRVDRLLQNRIGGLSLHSTLELDKLVEGVNVLTVVVIEKGGRRHQQNVTFTVGKETATRLPEVGAVRPNVTLSGKIGEARKPRAPVARRLGVAGGDGRVKPINTLLPADAETLSALRDETSRSAKRGSETHFQPKGRSGDAVRR